MIPEARNILHFYFLIEFPFLSLNERFGRLSFHDYPPDGA
jgi:hypothetical protein